VVVTNSDHLRDAPALAARWSAELVGPAGERGALGADAARWLSTDDTVVDGLVAVALDGSKTKGELALILEGTTLITGDLVRSHAGGTLCLLPDPKLSDRAAAITSVRALSARGPFDAVLVGDGWPIFRDGQARLDELLRSLA
jgi:hypothetical protein